MVVREAGGLAARVQSPASRPDTTFIVKNLNFGWDFFVLLI